MSNENLLVTDNYTAALSTKELSGNPVGRLC